jgi:CheY-like chemotaxis protein
VGEAEDADGALARVERLRPNLVLMDIDLPGADGVRATRRIKAAFSKAGLSTPPHPAPRMHDPGRPG